MAHAPDRKAPVTADRLAAMLAHVPMSQPTLWRADRALLTLGFAAALRLRPAEALRTWIAAAAIATGSAA